MVQAHRRARLQARTFVVQVLGAQAGALLLVAVVEQRREAGQEALGLVDPVGQSGQRAHLQREACAHVGMHLRARIPSTLAHSFTFHA